jgi:hypothetical protein
MVGAQCRDVDLPGAQLCLSRDETQDRNGETNHNVDETALNLDTLLKRWKLSIDRLERLSCTGAIVKGLILRSDSCVIVVRVYPGRIA